MAANPFDTMVLPPELMQALARLAGGERPAFHGMKVIENPLARITRRIPDRLQRSRTFPFRDYELTYKEVSEPVAIMFSAPALGFLRPLPPIYKRDLSAFQGSEYGVISMAAAVAG